ncbi:MAG: M48 family metallopeptidase [Acidobacteriota bacterium]
MRFVPKQLHKTSDISRGDHSRYTFLKNTASLVIVLGSLYLILGLLGEFLALTIPESWEARLLPAGGFDSSVETPEFLEARAVFDRLIQDLELRPLPYELFLSDEETPNAFAIPGGGVGITSGMLDQLESEIGMAMVLGHELGHQQHRHHLRRMGRSLIHQVAFSFLFGNTGNSLMQTTLTAGELRYSRRQEMEADGFGLKLVYRIYGRTDGCLEFFEILQEDPDSDLSPWTAFLLTHPLTGDRIASLRELQYTLSSPDLQ